MEELKREKEELDALPPGEAFRREVFKVNFKNNMRSRRDKKDEEMLKGLPVRKLEDHKAFLSSKKKAKTVKELMEVGYCDEEEAKEYDQETVILASFVRSGNSLSRGSLEKLTGIMTGSDCPL